MGCIKIPICRSRKYVVVVKVDGKVIKSTTPLLVGELLVNFEGLGVKSSRKSSKLLSPCYELQLGKTYYLFPCKYPVVAKNQVHAGVSTGVEAARSAAVKRIKVVITKKQLEELLSKKTSVEKIIFGIDKACATDLATGWKPNLVPIPEEVELINM